MPFLGYFLGSVFGATIKNVDHWISFVLLGAIGANMIKESFEKEESCKDCGFGIKTMFIMAVATSIDAFASGIAINVQNGNIWIALIFIGVITFVFSVFGVKLGGFTGAKYKSKAEFFGGAVLILLGLKILLEDLF